MNVRMYVYISHPHLAYKRVAKCNPPNSCMIYIMSIVCFGTLETVLQSTSTRRATMITCTHIFEKVLSEPFLILIPFIERESNAHSMTVRRGQNAHYVPSL